MSRDDRLTSSTPNTVGNDSGRLLLGGPRGESTAAFDVNLMLLFHEVVNAGSINQAATSSHIPKATISRKLRRLEQEVGAVLLKRGVQKLSMTGSGEVLYQHCKKLLGDVEAARAAVTEVQTELSGSLYIATAFGLAAWVNTAVARFTQQHPNVELIIDQTNRWIDLSEERYDLVIHLGRIRNKNLPVRRFKELGRGVYASPGYLESQGTPRTPRELLQHRCIVLQQQLDDGLWSFQHGLNAPDIVRPRIRANDIVIAHNLARAGLGCAILPHAICRHDLREERLVRILADWRIPALVPAVTYLEHRYLPLRARAFIDTLAQEFNSDIS